MRELKLAPSILSADFARLGADVERVHDVASLLHVDVMDGHFVPNLTIGPPVVKSLRAHTDLFLDCHLMVDNPGVLLADFADAGADRCIVHVELGDPRPLFDELRARRVGVGLVLNPPTPVDAVMPYLDEIDLLLVMSVNPGWGGQSFIPEVLDKVAAVRKEIDARGLKCEIEIDGGINVDTAANAAAAGVDILVAGSAVFRADDPVAASHAILAAGASRTGVSPAPEVNVHLVAKVLVVSDGVHEGTREDRAGPKVVARLADAGWAVIEHQVTADGIDEVAFALRDLVAGFTGVVVTTGGTGFGPRDLTPEGTRIIIDREAPGLAEAMRRASDTPGKPFGMLGRGVCGTVGTAIVCNLPGSSNGALECLEVVLPALPHALDLLSGGRPH